MWLLVHFSTYWILNDVDAENKSEPNLQQKQCCFTEYYCLKFRNHQYWNLLSNRRKRYRYALKNEAILEIQQILLSKVISTKMLHFCFVRLKNFQTKNYLWFYNYYAVLKSC